MTYLTRDKTGLPGPTDGMFVSSTEKTRFVVHWDGGRNPTSAADELVLLRAYAQHHINQGWDGPGYNLAVGPLTGNVYEFRGLAAVGAHAPGANRSGIGCILIGGPDNLTTAGKRGLREAYALACSWAGRTLTQEVHSDVVSTSCPGDTIRSWVHGGGLGGGTAPVIPPAAAPRFPATDIYGEAFVARVQAKFIRLGYDLGADGADGLDGAKTQAAARAVQKRGGITQDGIIGPNTEAVADKLLAGGKPASTPKPKPKPKAPAYPLPDGYYVGPADGGTYSISGYHSHRDAVRKFQQRLKDRGWNIVVDGLYGTATRSVLIAFQKEKGLVADGLGGPATWKALWEAPIT